MYRHKHTLLASCFALAHLVALPEASAVGYGLEFEVNEDAVDGLDPQYDADPNQFKADSLDFSYHACVEVGGPNNRRMLETGYFWISSYQIGNILNNGSVVDSQINYYEDNGYHIYAKYTYQAFLPPPPPPQPQPTLTGLRYSYEVEPYPASIALFVDPHKDTKLRLDQDCGIRIAGNDDDSPLGDATIVVQGEKYETNGLANGDFKIVFDNWSFTALGNSWLNPLAGAFNELVFNGNVTELGGPLGDNHRPEGSGNLFWSD